VDQGLVTLVGMSIAYVASLMGMLLAYWAWRRRKRDTESQGRS
jgi:H+/gluconate symporter-like permease